jgi:hypothetical protein
MRFSWHWTRTTKLISSFLVGKRSSQNTRNFLLDVRRRIENHRRCSTVQLTTDAYIFYRQAVEQSLWGFSQSISGKHTTRQPQGVLAYLGQL